MLALSCDHKLADEDDPTTKIWVRKVVDGSRDKDIYTQSQMSNHPGSTKEDSLGSQSRPGRVWCIPYESSLLSSLPCMHPYGGDGQLQWSTTAYNLGTKWGHTSKWSLCRFRVFQTPQRECTRDENPARSKSKCLPLSSAQRLRQTQNRPVDKAPACVVVRKQVEEREVRLCLQCCLAMAREDAVGLSPHSFRIGAVSEAVGRGALEVQLRMMGRWRSNAYMRYVRPSPRMPLHWVGIVVGGGRSTDCFLRSLHWAQRRWEIWASCSSASRGGR